MKQTISIFLCLMILGVSFQDTVTFVSWKLNQDYISKYLCIDKNVKESSCKGHCQLEDRFNDSKEEQSKFPNYSKERLTNDYLQPNLIKKSDVISSKEKTFFDFREFYSFLYNTKIFHPPKV